MTNSKEEFIGKLQSEMSKPGPPRVSRGPPTVRAQEQSAWNAPPSFSQQIPQQGYIEEDDYDSATGLPGKVAVYISNLYQAMVENDVAGVRYLYFKGWQEVTKSHFQNSEWPSAEQVAPLCDDNEVFLLCYQELCNRHLFMSKTLKASIVHRFESWNTYRNLFDMFLDGATTSKLLLPLEWLNDMIDEFLYQWQEFSTFRHRTRDQTELELLRGNPNAWKVQTVLGYLTSFVERSQISRDAKSNAAAHGNGQYSILQAMGTFSLVGLCRAQVLLADYRYAMRVLDPLDIDDQRALFNLVAPCAVTLFSNLGFAYMMSKRYADAVQMFTRILTTHRTSKENQTSFAEDHTTQRHDKTIALCGLCYALSPGLRLDEQVRRQIQGHEKYERLLNIQSSRASDETLKYFEDVFNVVCPKFVNPATPVALLPKVEGQAPVAAAVPTVKEVGDARQNLRVQMRWFLEDARQQLSLPTIRSYLKLYKSIPMEKLARFNQMEPDQFRQNLIFIKARSSQVVRGISDGSAPIEGTRTTVSDVHFYVVGDKDPANDMVHIVADITNTRQQWVSKFFSSNALKLQGTMGDLQRDQLRDIESPVDDYPDDLSDM